MKLFYAETMNSYKTCAVARHVDLDVKFHRLDLKKGEQRAPEFLAINPNGKAPALADGDRTIWESNAIMCHLAIRSESDLWPRGDGQVEVVRWFSWASDHFCRYAGQLYFEYVIRAEFGMGAPDQETVEEALGYVRRYGAILDDHLENRAYLLGDTLTVADFAVATVLPYAKGANIPLSEFPAVERWHDRLMELPAWQSPFGV
ncbi:MAG: glutathione S-transferase family protein [Alphaproteobacteria bacterium]|nr:glutathione S-transferase family protein [Alphaproteobacteria bacterium]